MITIETLEKIAGQNQTGIFPNIIREYFQHLFLSELHKTSDAEKMLFKGGTALRIIYNSPRFSEDMDFSLFETGHHKVRGFTEGLFVGVLAEMERAGIKVELNGRSDITNGGYFGSATFKLFDYPPVMVEINISTRHDKNTKPEIDSITGDFVPTYNLFHLPQNDIVEEKIFGALMTRKKPRDFYDLYFIMRKGMISHEQKIKLAAIKKEIINNAQQINFCEELGVFLPVDQQTIIRDFLRALEAELNRQVI